MKDKKSKSIKLFSLLLMSILLVCGGCDKNKFKGAWEDEVKLYNGQLLWVKRSVEYTRNGRDFITHEGGNITSMAVTIEIPKNNPIAPAPPIWRFNAVPIVLDYDPDRKTWFVVATYFYCNSWVEAGRPTLEQWQYVVKDNQWVIVPLDRKLLGRLTNLMASFSKAKQLKKVTVNDINKSIQHFQDGDIYREVRVGRRPNCN